MSDPVVAGGWSKQALVSALYIHPIKACRGLRVERAVVERRGLAEDRRFMLVDESGRFVTQREEPRLVLVGVDARGDRLRMSVPGHGECDLPRRPTGGRRLTVEVWRSRVSALVVEEVGAWLSEWLGRGLTLVYMGDDVERLIDEEQPEHGVVSFADGYPLLLTNEASLAALAGRSGGDLTMTRFRPNLVVTGAAAFVEERWARLRVGSVVLRNANPCERCVVINVDPESGERGREPLRTLVEVHSIAGKPSFGVNLVPETVGEIRVGDPVSILSEA
ncbi:MAG: MOSC domain-containing protein [Polyangiaceae bacterium]|nr:MOSC domain-containing protein [Polyangiaceae bacterium]